MPTNKPKISVLFLCTGNSCRSQMAEGWARHLKSREIDPYSAGVISTRLDPLAVKVMAEAGVNISKHESKVASDLPGQEFDYVITLCDHAHETCPYFPAETEIIHKGFDDPPMFATRAKNEQEALVIYRRVRDEIRALIETLPGSLDSQGDAP